jgi:hypothetical protein
LLEGGGQAGDGRLSHAVGPAVSKGFVHLHTGERALK